MYYHPFMLDAAYRDRMFEALNALVRGWHQIIDRQREVQTDAFKDFCNAQLHNVRTLADTTDAARLAAHLLACAASEPLKLVAVSSQLGEIVADTQCQLIQLMDSQLEQMNALAVRSTDNVEQMALPLAKAASGTTR